MTMAAQRRNMISCDGKRIDAIGRLFLGCGAKNVNGVSNYDYMILLVDRAIYNCRIGESISVLVYDGLLHELDCQKKGQCLWWEFLAAIKWFCRSGMHGSNSVQRSSLSGFYGSGADLLTQRIKKSTAEDGVVKRRYVVMAMLWLNGRL
eukprot:c22401_g1_i3 orf=3-446(-)